MAENKKSFIAYSDWKDTFDALPNDKAGLLIKHIFSYVNDENPETDDILINAVFANIKNTLKRDLDKWGKQYKQRVEAGKKSAEVRKQNATVVNGRSVSSTVSVSDSVNVNNKKHTKKVCAIPELKEFMIYAKSKITDEKEYKSKRDNLILKYESWVEAGWKDGFNKPIKNWKSKLLNNLQFIQSKKI